MSIHIIGDSHGGAFYSIGAKNTYSCISGSYWDLNDEVNSNGVYLSWIGPVTAFRIARDGLDIRQYHVKNNDIVIYNFGEIDCRTNIHKHVQENNNYQENIKNIVDGYIKTVQLNHKNLNLHTSIIYNVIPTFKITKDDKTDHGQYPFLGTNEDRKNYTLYFNKLLKQECIKYNILFFDVYDMLVSEDGFLDSSISNNDGIHVDSSLQNTKDIISDFIVKNLPITLDISEDDDRLDDTKVGVRIKLL